jgi:hypothetical protein
MDTQNPVFKKLVRKDIPVDVNEHERLSHFTLIHISKVKQQCFIEVLHSTVMVWSSIRIMTNNLK